MLSGRRLIPLHMTYSPSSRGAIDELHSSIQAHGLQATVDRWEAHWSSALSDDDIRFLAEEARCTAVRIPIGYFSLG